MFPISRDPPKGGTMNPMDRLWLSIIGEFPISRDPPEGGTAFARSSWSSTASSCFQFLGIPPKGERSLSLKEGVMYTMFPISRDPPEGGTVITWHEGVRDSIVEFPISRDPPEGGTTLHPSCVIDGIPVSNF